ncbi:hypothetical protein FGB62_179g03 [Gracilaria domingensis]|nr:hypothetical protein FGB62_179g03 [Gracilaria domingensis]
MADLPPSDSELQAEMSTLTRTTKRSVRTFMANVQRPVRSAQFQEAINRIEKQFQEELDETKEKIEAEVLDLDLGKMIEGMEKEIENIMKVLQKHV